MKQNKTLEALVIEEAINLKKFATKTELGRLNLKTLNGDNKIKCVYGQMTGNCQSERAYELIRKCATKVYKVIDNDTFSGKLNGSPKVLENRYSRLYEYTSPIENLVYLPKKNTTFKKEKIEKLISFLKDKNATELKF